MTGMMGASVVSAERLQALLANPQIPAEHRALWALMGKSRVRLADALSADVRDADLQAGELTVEMPVRGSEPETVCVDHETVALLRQVIGGRTSGPLLANRAGRAVSREAASRWARGVGHAIHEFRPKHRALTSPED